MFSVIFDPFHWFDPKKSFRSNHIFKDLPNFKFVEKNNFLSNSYLLSEIVTFKQREFL